MENLKAIEVAGISVIRVNGVRGQNIFEAAKEAVYLCNLLKVVIDIYWNGNWLRVYRGTTVDQIITASIHAELQPKEHPVDCRNFVWKNHEQPNPDKIFRETFLDDKQSGPAGS